MSASERLAERPRSKAAKAGVIQETFDLLCGLLPGTGVLDQVLAVSAVECKVEAIILKVFS